MKTPTVKISISLPPEMAQWLEDYGNNLCRGIKVPISRIILKALEDLREKTTSQNAN